MIFKKFLCGGFGILMSQNDQVEKNLAFQCCAKMVGLRRHGSILNPQVTPKDSQAALTYQNTTQIHQDSPSDSPRHPQTASATIDTTVYLQTFKVVIWCVSIWGAEWRWSHHTILAQHWNARFFSTWSFWDIKIPKPPHKSFIKIIELDHFLYFLGSSERYYLYQLLLITL